LEQRLTLYAIATPCAGRSLKADGLFELAGDRRRLPDQGALARFGVERKRLVGPEQGDAALSRSDGDLQRLRRFLTGPRKANPPRRAAVMLGRERNWGGDLGDSRRKAAA
jgi:hypothetical protein